MSAMAKRVEGTGAPKADGIHPTASTIVMTRSGVAIEAALTTVKAASIASNLATGTAMTTRMTARTTARMTGTDAMSTAGTRH